VKSVARLRSLFHSVTHRSRLEAEMGEEFRFHLDLRTEDLIRNGLPRDEARRRAHIELGSIAACRDDCRDAIGLRLIDELRADLRYAVRGLRRSPAFSVATIGILAVGIGLNTAVFTVTSATLFNGFRLVDRSDRILYIHSQKNGQYSGVSYPDLEDWRAETQSLVELGAVADMKVILNDERTFPERHTATRITPNTFRLLGVQPLLGRDFGKADALPGATSVAILTYKFWQRGYGKDPKIIGKTLHINGAPPATVVGVMPDGFSFPQNQDLWIPLIQTPDLQQRDARTLWIAFGRMADGVTRDEVKTEFRTIGNRLAAAYPQTNEGQLPQIDSFISFFVSSNAALIFGALWGAVGFVLLIACANLANLTLARAIDRSREISVHVALGASRWRVIRRIITESLVLASIGGFFGWLLAKVAIRTYELVANPLAEDWNYGLVSYTMDYRVLAYFLTITVAAALLFGLAPALRFYSLSPSAVLKDGGHGMTGGRVRRRLSSSLVVSEVALAMLLLAGAGVMIRSFLKIANADVGARLDQTIEMLLRLSESKYSNQVARNAFFEHLKTRLEAIPGIESVSTGPTPAGGVQPRIPYEASGSEPEDQHHRPTTTTLTIGPDYFRTLGARVLSGREFNVFDRDLALPVAIVNERFAKQQWPGQNALGQRLRLFSGDKPQTWFTVVGMASNVVYDRARQEISPVVYLSARQVSQSQEAWVFARTSIPAHALAKALRQEIGALDQDVIIWLGPYDVADRLARGGLYGNLRKQALLLLVFACVALIMAALGLFTVSAYSVSHRIQEFGIRMAIGATKHDILTLVLKRGMIQVGVGLGIGLLASIAVNRILESQLLQISPCDPLTLMISSIALVLAATIGCLIPARRAIRVDPVVALRHD
jgi:putative ABC transport system permease protein